MIELGKIKIKDDISIIEAGNKIRILAQDLKFDAIAATRLATITLEISRLIYQKGEALSIKVGFQKPGTFKTLQAEEDKRYGLSLNFQSKIKDLNITKAESFFDKLNAVHTEDGFQSIEAFKFIPDPGFEPTPQFIDIVKEKLLRLSKEELFSEVKKKNIELLNLLEERNRVLSELEEKTNELERATRLKTEFLANMSHELRTPLNSIIGFSGRVIKKAGDLLPKRQQKNLETVLRNAHHLLGLINELLDISKIEAGKMEVFLEEFRLSALVSEVLELSQTLIGEKELKIVTDLPAKQIVLYSDKIKLKQILINLISNAVKFTEEGSITIQAREVDSPAGGDAFFRSQMDYVSLSVADTGIGMSPEDLQYVYEAFRQVDGSLTRKVGGTGLGLNITKKFIELLQGKIEVDSVKGKGTTFTIIIPVISSDAVDIRKEEEVFESEEHELPAIGPTVLCIDDDPEVLDLLHGYLSDEGYKVITAAGGEEGLKKALGMQPFAITLDIQMPHMDGWTVLKELKERDATKDIPVIIVTIVDNIGLGYRLGAYEYLQKPILPETLISTIEKILRRKAETVLVVDDEPEVLELVRQFLADEKINVRTAENGLKALDSLKGMIPDLILLDLVMPGMDGLQVINRLRKTEEWAEIPVIIITAKTLDEQERLFLNKRVEAIITKEGMSIDVVLKEIAEAMRRIEIQKP